MTPEERRLAIIALRERIGQLQLGPTKRKGFTPAQRKAVYETARGSCQKCGEWLGDVWHIDHRIPLAQGGAHAPSNWDALCVSCHRQKTKADVGQIAKTKRIIKRETEGKKPSRLKSRGFSKTLRKKMDGTVERR